MYLSKAAAAHFRSRLFIMFFVSFFNIGVFQRSQQGFEKCIKKKLVLEKEPISEVIFVTPSHEPWSKSTLKMGLSAPSLQSRVIVSCETIAVDSSDCLTTHRQVNLGSWMYWTKKHLHPSTSRRPWPNRPSTPRKCPSWRTQTNSSKLASASRTPTGIVFSWPGIHVTLKTLTLNLLSVVWTLELKLALPVNSLGTPVASLSWLLFTQ